MKPLLIGGGIFFILSVIILSSPNKDSISHKSTASQETIFHSFTGGDDGATPQSLMQGKDGNFYGTTDDGNSLKCSDGCGKVFKLTPEGQKTILYKFAGGTNDGATPKSLIQGKDGNFYGITYYGGIEWSRVDGGGFGTLFKLTPEGQETILYKFAGGDDGEYPNNLIQGSDGNFYGTTKFGGDGGDVTPVISGNGTIFKITPQGQETMLYSFAKSESDVESGGGANPQAGLIQGSDGNFYGTTSRGGGTGDNGTLFKITPAGIKTTLYSFTDDADGYPNSLIQGSDGNFYGITSGVGDNNNDDDIENNNKYGTVFKITPQGVESELYSFAGQGVENDGAQPNSLIQGSDGNFYGTTTYGGRADNCNYDGNLGCGTVFKLTLQGQETVLYSFAGGTNDGYQPNSLIQGSDGNFDGNTSWGGVVCVYKMGIAVGCGTIFKLSIN